MYLGRYGERILLTFTLGIQIVQAKKILKYIPDSGLSRFPLGVSVCTVCAGQTPVLQQNWQRSEKSQLFIRKTQYLMNTLY